MITKEPTYYDWVELIEGVLLTLCGFTTFLLPIYLPEKLILLFGVIATMIGIANIFLYVKSGHEIGISRTLTLVGRYSKHSCGTPPCIAHYDAVFTFRCAVLSLADCLLPC